MTPPPELFRRDKFNQHWVSTETGAICDSDDVDRILEIKRLASLPPPERQAVVRARLRQALETL